MELNLKSIRESYLRNPQVFRNYLICFKIMHESKKKSKMKLESILK